MPSPEAWLRGAIEEGAEVPAYPVSVPEGVAPPFIRYYRSATVREPSLDGEYVPVGMFVIEVYADGYLAGKQLADQVRLAVNNFSGTVSETTIQNVVLVEELDGDPVFLEGRDSPTFMVEQTYSVRWQE